MSEQKEMYELKKSVEVGYPGKFADRPNKHGKFLCEKDPAGNFLTDKDDYDLKEFFTPEERESFYGHVKGILQGLETKFPPAINVLYKEAETITNDKGKEYQKVKVDGSVLKPEIFAVLPEDKKADYKECKTSEMSYSITGNKYSKDGKDYSSFQLTITSNKKEAICVTYNKNCEATFIRYNPDNTFDNNHKPSATNKWVPLDQNTAFVSEVLRNFATDLAATVVRTGSGRSLPTLYSEVNNYIKENSPKTKNAEGKEVAEYYSTGFHYANSPIKDRDGNILKDEKGNDRRYARDNFGFMNHNSESITLNISDNEITGIYYRNLETKDSLFNSDADALAKIGEKCVDKGFIEILNNALVNYSRNVQKINEGVVQDEKDDSFMNVPDEIDRDDMPF